MPKGLHAFHFRAQNYGLYSFSAIKSFLVLRFLLYGERLCPCFCRLHARWFVDSWEEMCLNWSKPAKFAPLTNYLRHVAISEELDSSGGYAARSLELFLFRPGQFRGTLEAVCVYGGQCVDAHSHFCAVAFDLLQDRCP